MVWHTVNPDQMKGSWWEAFGAFGTWYAGTMTLGAVVVALRQVQQNRLDAERAIAEARRQHQEQLRHAVRQADGASVSAILVSLDELVRAMKLADRDVAEFRDHRRDLENGEFPVPDEDESYHEGWKKSLRKHLAPVRNIRSGLITTSDSVRTPELVAVLEEAKEMVQALGDQIHAWSKDAGSYRDLGEPLQQVAKLMTSTDGTEKLLEGIAGRTQEVVREALRKDPTPDLWPDSDQTGLASNK